MQIERVTLNNVRKHVNREFVFAPGVNLLYGENGAGKSSVVEAISFVFDHLSVKQSDFIHGGDTWATVDVIFNHKGRRWLVERGLGDRSCFNVFQDSGQDDWEQRGSGKAQCMAVLHDALDMPSDVDLAKIARDALIPPQGELTAGFNLPETARIDYFTPVLDLDKYRRAWRALQAPGAELGGELERARGILSGLRRGIGDLTLSQATEKLNAANLDILRMQKELSDIEQRVTDQAETLGTLQAEWKQSETKRVQLADYQGRAARLQARIEGFEAFLPELEALPGLKEEQAAIVLDDTLQERYQAAFVGVTNLEHAGLRLSEKLELARQDYQSALLKSQEADQARELLPDLQFSLQAAEMKLQHAREQYALQTSEIARHTEALGLIEPGKPCPVCGELLTEATAAKRQVEIAQAKQEAEEALKGASTVLKTIPDKIAVLRAKTQDYQSRIDQDPGTLPTLDQCAEIESLLIANEEALKTAKDRMVGLAEELETQKAAKVRHDELSRAVQALLMKQVQVKDLDDLRNERDSFLSRAKALESELADAPNLIMVNEAIRLLALEREELEEKKLALDALKLSRANFEQAIEIINEANQVADQMSGLEEAEALLNRCRQAVSDIGPKIADQVMIQLGALASQYWRDMGKSGVLQWDGLFAVSVDGLDYRTQLSGGQKVIAALACRLAIAKYRADLGFMILDEPTIHLDLKSKQGLVEVVAGLGLEQIIIVSHDDSFTAAATNVIEV